MLDSVSALATFAEPSKDTDQLASPVMPMVAGLSSLVAVPALPVMLPVIGLVTVRLVNVAVGAVSDVVAASVVKAPVDGVTLPIVVPLICPPVICTFDAV